jgi:hypothetical protein
MRRAPTSFFVLSSILLSAALAAAQARTPAGTVAALQGRAEAQTGGQATWRALATGKDVFAGERLRTGEASRLKLLMRDDSVVTLGPKSELTIDQLVVRDGGGTTRLGAAVGAVRAVVTDRYGTKGSSFEVKTPTAVAGVRGTGFVALVDDDGKRTRVIGLYDVTWVRSVTDAAGRHEVRVGPGQITEVIAGGLPTKPRNLTASQQDALAASTVVTPSPPEGGAPGGPTPGGEGVPDEGSGDPGDPATPGQPGGPALQRPDAKIDQPIDRLRQNREPPPPPPRK